MLTREHYIQAADLLKVNVAAIRAVAEVESSGHGMVTMEGREVPLILFEPHVFWKELKKRGLNPEKYVLGNGDLLYKKWGHRPYPKTQAERHKQLERACVLHREAALCSASYGKFQLMGFNHRLCGCDTVQDFINKVYSGEPAHLTLFCRFLKSCGLVDALRKRDWKAFAQGYNGEGYKANRYDLKMAAAFLRFAAEQNV